MKKIIIKWNEISENSNVRINSCYCFKRCEGLSGQN
jgi:hypothetical protein